MIFFLSLFLSFFFLPVSPCYDTFSCPLYSKFPLSQLAPPPFLIYVPFVSYVPVCFLSKLVIPLFPLPFCTAQYLSLSVSVSLNNGSSFTRQSLTHSFSIVFYHYPSPSPLSLSLYVSTSFCLSLHIYISLPLHAENQAASKGIQARQKQNSDANEYTEGASRKCTTAHPSTLV